MFKQLCGVGLPASIKIELTARLYKGASHVFAATLACCVTALIELVNHRNTGSWVLLALTVASSIFRLALFPGYRFRCRRMVMQPGEARLWSTAFSLGAMSLAFCVMLGIIQAFHTNEVEEQATLFALSLGLTAGTAMRLSVQPWTGIGTALILLPVLSVCNLEAGGQNHLVLGFYAILYTFIILVNIIHGHTEFIKSIRATQEVERLASHDKLTGLFNRLGFGAAFSQVRERTIAKRSSFALLMIDLDRFKAVNDIYGHGAGDSLLVEVGLCLRDCAADDATIARLGGDEFAIIKEAEEAEAAHLALRIVGRLRRPFRIDGKDLEIGSSIGVFCCGHSEDFTLDEMLKSADFALYKAKNGGRNQHVQFVPGMLDEINQRQSLEVSLAGALAKGELSVVYQPVVETRSREIVGVEALVRWNHPELGTVLPGVFIPLAEDLGIIAEIGQFVLETACQEVAAWPYQVFVAVNVSPLQFAQGDLPDRVFRTLAKTGLPAVRLELEITEGVLLDAYGKSKSALDVLRAHGVRITLDDFGTGWASINYLWRYTFDKIKIDKGFVAACVSDPRAGAIVRGIISLAGGLKLPIVAEGVETAEQASMLDDMECSHMQGYLFGMPMSSNDAGLLVQKRRVGVHLSVVGSNG